MKTLAKLAVPVLEEARPRRDATPSSHCRDWLIKELTAAWRTAGYPALARLSAAPRDGALLIRGTVPSFFLKQIAQEIALRVCRRETILNEIAVVGPAAQTASAMRGGTNISFSFYAPQGKETL